MKIGYILDTTLDIEGGVQRYFKDLAKYMVSKRHEVRFLVPPSKVEGFLNGRVISFGRNVVVRGNANTVPTVFGVKKEKIKEMLAREDFDVLHVSSPFSPLLGGKILKLSTVPIVSGYMVYNMNNLLKLGAKLLGIVMRGSYKKIDAYYALSRAAKGEAEFTMPGDYKVIPAGVDIDNFSPEVEPLKKFEGKEKNILYLGRLEERKGVHYLISAFAKITGQYPNTRLIIAGDGPERRRLEKLAKKLKMDNVVFEGFIDEELKPNYYASADLCVFPATKGESFGIVLIEAMASGKVTLGFSNEGYSCVLENLPELIVENKNIDSLAGKISSFLEDEALTEKFEKRCLKEAQKYSWERVGGEIEKVYEECLK